MFVKYFPIGENMGNPGKFKDNISWNGKKILMLKNFSLNWVLFSLTRNKLSQIGFLFSHLGNTFSHIEFYFHGWEKYPLSGLYFLGLTQFFHILGFILLDEEDCQRLFSWEELISQIGSDKYSIQNTFFQNGNYFSYFANW